MQYCSIASSTSNDAIGLIVRPSRDASVKEQTFDLSFVLKVSNVLQDSAMRFSRDVIGAPNELDLMWKLDDAAQFNCTLELSVIDFVACCKFASLFNIRLIAEFHFQIVLTISQVSQAGSLRNIESRT